MSYLKAEERYDADAFLREPEMAELYAFNRHAFSWKPGRYIASIEMNSPEKFNVVDGFREFSLNPLDIENMEKNKRILELDYKRMVLGNDEKLEWQWCNPALVKVSE